MKKKYVLGALANLAFLGLYVFLFEINFKILVNRFGLSFLGDFWVFTATALLVPTTLFVIGKREMATGALWGVTVLYCVIGVLTIFFCE